MREIAYIFIHPVLNYSSLSSIYYKIYLNAAEVYKLYPNKFILLDCIALEVFVKIISKTI